jgi:hypothetical protein
VGEARAALTALGKSGTCLSRSLTIAAVLPGSDVVIAFHREGPSKRNAHAWVELRGAAIAENSETEMFQEIARLKGR